MTEKIDTFLLFDRAVQHRDRMAIISDGRSYSYQELLDASDRIFVKLRGNVQPGDRIAFLLDPSFAYVAVQWGIWKANCIGVPLCAQHPKPALSYTLRDAEVTLAIGRHGHLQTLTALGSALDVEILDYDSCTHLDCNENTSFPALDLDAMMLYTSGTTNHPKGVVSTFGNIQAQIETLVSAWRWDTEDHILNVLPLHHVHGIINVVGCALWSGACVQFIRKFDAQLVHAIFMEGQVNIFMAVPTIYHKLISHWRNQSDTVRKQIGACLSKFRLMVSGSAALPVSVLEQWREISGQVLLERYGMTEIGMALSNPYQGERRPGFVGSPLPGVEIRLVDQGEIIVKEGQPGEIQVKSKAVFARYWNRVEASAQAFTADGWFKTGDIAQLERGYYRILGRSSVDIIKSGGYKISALEIESCMLQHPDVVECAVVGIKDEQWGQIVAATVVSSEHLKEDELKTWLQQRLAAYQVPRKFIYAKSIPKNTIGKVTKKEVIRLFSGQ